MSPTLAARTGVAVEGWVAAVRAATQPLMEAGVVDESYVNSCIAIVEEQGPYIVVAPGIALAHARPENGVRSLGVSVAVLTRPVEFGHPDNDPVDLVFAFGTPDREQHVGILAALAQALNNSLAETLRAAPDDDAALAALEEVMDGT